MTAMDAATRNAKDMVDRLTLYMNKVRQAAITREIIESVSGAQATVSRREPDVTRTTGAVERPPQARQ